MAAMKGNAVSLAELSPALTGDRDHAYRQAALREIRTASVISRVRVGSACTIVRGGPHFAAFSHAAFVFAAGPRSPLPAARQE